MDICIVAGHTISGKGTGAIGYINESNEVFNAKEGFTTTDALEANLDILSNNF